MVEKLKEALDKELTTGILLTDLTKAFDCISHDLLIAKLRAYGFSKTSLKLIFNYSWTSNSGHFYRQGQVPLLGVGRYSEVYYKFSPCPHANLKGMFVFLS